MRVRVRACDPGDRYVKSFTKAKIIVTKADNRAGAEGGGDRGGALMLHNRKHLRVRASFKFKCPPGGAAPAGKHGAVSRLFV